MVSRCYLEKKKQVRLARRIVGRGWQTEGKTWMKGEGQGSHLEGDTICAKALRQGHTLLVSGAGRRPQGWGEVIKETCRG